jgi:hypothetical protein
MSSNIFRGVSARAGAVALGLALSQGALFDVSAGEQTAAQAVEQTGESAPQVPPETGQAEAGQGASQFAAERINAARAAMEARHAEHMARMETRREEMRERAAAQGIEIPEVPAPPEPPRWLSYEEMQAEMKSRGIEMQPLPQSPSAAAAEPVPQRMPFPRIGAMSADEHKRVFDIIEAMTPEQQQACFAISSWHVPGATMPPPVYRPMPGRQMGPWPGYRREFPQGFGPGQRGYAPGQMIVPLR